MGIGDQYGSPRRCYTAWKLNVACEQAQLMLKPNCSCYYHKKSYTSGMWSKNLILHFFRYLQNV